MISLLLPKRTTTRLSTLKDPEDWLVGAIGGTKTSAGVRVNPNSALSLIAYFAAIRAISEDIAKLPLPLYRRLKPRGKKRLPQHPTYKLLHDQPNPNMSAMSFREALTAHALGWGNGYAEISKSADGKPAALWPLSPESVTPFINDGGAVEYRVSGSGRQRVLRADHMFHLHGLGFDGLTGYSLATLGREAIGLGLVTENSGGRLFSSGSRPGGALEHPSKLDDSARKNLRESWERIHGGSENVGKVAILEEGIKFTPYSISNIDAQWLGAREFSIAEIARLARIPPHKIQDLSRATFSNIEMQSIEYVTDTLMSWSVRWEQEIKRKLLIPGREDDLFAEHLFMGLLRGAQKDRFAAYATARQWGWASANDVLEFENQNPIGEQGDIYMVPLNMAPADKLGEEPEPAPQPTTPAPPPPAPEAPENTENAAQIIDRLAEAHMPVLRAAYHKVLRLECDKIQRASKQHSDLASWLTEFWPEHYQHVRLALSIPVDTFCRSAWCVVDDRELPFSLATEVAEYTKSMADEHLAVSKMQVREISRGDVAHDNISRNEAVSQMSGLCDILKRHARNGALHGPCNN